MISLALLCLMLLAPMHGARQNSAPRPVNNVSAELEAVLTQMDKASTGFKTAQADFNWDNYQKVVDETEKQTGHVYFRRSGAVEAMFDITSTPTKQVLFKDGKLDLYNPKIDQITQYVVGKNKAAVESYLGLGFGARGHDLLKTYHVKMAGWETVDGVKTAKLELVSTEPKVSNMFSQFVLWIDLQRDVPLKQQVFEPAGDYWLSHYTSIKLNSRIPDDAFRIKTTPHTKIVSPQ